MRYCVDDFAGHRLYQNAIQSLLVDDRISIYAGLTYVSSTLSPKKTLAKNYNLYAPHVYLPSYYLPAASIDDLINQALAIVRPIFDTSRPIMQQQNNPIIRQSSSAVPSSSVILGAPKYIRIDDVPICMGNSRICKFISCTAHNFKNDESFANLNLAAQVLSDKKLRQAISSDPDTLRTICHEQQLAPAQCKLFTDGFVLIDRFITSIEGGGDGDGRRVRVIHATTTTMQSPFRQETISPAAAAADTMPGVVDERYGRTAPQQRASRTTQFDDNQQHPLTMRRTILNPYLFDQQSNWFADSSTVKGAEDFIDYDDFGNIYERHHTKRATRDELDRSARRTLGESVLSMTSRNQKHADDDTTTDYYDSVQEPTGDRQQRPLDCFAILG